MAGVNELIGKVNTYLTGKLPFKSFIINRYIMMMYDYDSNSILTEAIKK